MQDKHRRIEFCRRLRDETWRASINDDVGGACRACALRMLEPAVLVRMGMRFAERIVRAVVVLVMCVMHMRVRVREHLVLVLVLMIFGKV